jgi:hypothetical protein
MRSCSDRRPEVWRALIDSMVLPELVQLCPARAPARLSERRVWQREPAAGIRVSARRAAPHWSGAPTPANASANAVSRETSGFVSEAHWTVRRPQGRGGVFGRFLWRISGWGRRTTRP